MRGRPDEYAGESGRLKHLMSDTPRCGSGRLGVALASVSPTRLPEAKTLGCGAIRAWHVPALPSALGCHERRGECLQGDRGGSAAALQDPVPVRRYERRSPGELLHLETKKLGCLDKSGYRVMGDHTQKIRPYRLEGAACGHR